MAPLFHFSRLDQFCCVCVCMYGKRLLSFICLIYRLMSGITADNNGEKDRETGILLQTHMHVKKRQKKVVGIVVLSMDTIHKCRALCEYL